MANPLKYRWVVCLGLTLLAASLRFYKLGEWPFANDELATIAEERTLCEGQTSSPESQTYRLPRAIPLSYFFLHVGNGLFGRDEFGSRVITAIFGTLGVAVIFLLMDVLKGRPTAVACGLLMALWPDHVFQSQQTRFYIIVAFFAELALLLGALAAQRRSAIFAIVACLATFAALLCHAVMAILWGIIFLGIIAGSFAERRAFPRHAAWAFLATGIGIAAFGLLYLKPLMGGWNASESWGYGSLHSLMASVNVLGWPVALLGVLGMLLLMRERDAQSWYWVVCALGWVLASVLLPRFMVYHPAYVFPLAPAMIVVAACAIGTVHDRLRTKGAFVAAAWVGLACMATLPSLASHYKDGSRDDIRTPAQYIAKNWRSGDRVTGYAMGGFRHYAPGYEPAIPFAADPLETIHELLKDNQRVWIIVQSYRGGLPPDLEHYLGTHCSHELRVRRGRFDYADYCVDVFLFTPRSEK